MPDFTISLTTEQAQRARTAFAKILNFPEGELPAATDIESWIRREIRQAVEREEKKAHEESFAPQPFEVAP